MDGTDLASVVTTKARYEWEHDVSDPLRPDEPVAEERPNLHVVAYDYGIKHNILRMLSREGCRVTVVPAQTSAEDVLSLNRMASFSRTALVIPSLWTMRRRISASSWQEADLWDLPRAPAHWACTRGKTYKLKFGHHGGNHPVKRSSDGKVEITCHNHNFAVDPDSLNQARST